MINLTYFILDKIRFCFNKILGLDHFGLAHLSTLRWGFSFLPPSVSLLQQHNIKRQKEDNF